MGHRTLNCQNKDNSEQTRTSTTYSVTLVLQKREQRGGEQEWPAQGHGRQVAERGPRSPKNRSVKSPSRQQGGDFVETLRN